MLLAVVETAVGLVMSTVILTAIAIAAALEKKETKK